MDLIFFIKTHIYFLDPKFILPKSIWQFWVQFSPQIYLTQSFFNPKFWFQSHAISIFFLPKIFFDWKKNVFWSRFFFNKNFWTKKLWKQTFWQKIIKKFFLYFKFFWPKIFWTMSQKSLTPPHPHRIFQTIFNFWLIWKMLTPALGSS